MRPWARAVAAILFAAAAAPVPAEEPKPPADAVRERSAEECRKAREDAVTAHVDRLRPLLGKEWTVLEGKHFVVLSHADPRIAKDALNLAEALRGWLDENLGYVGNGYCGRIVIRVFADPKERDAAGAAPATRAAPFEAFACADRTAAEGGWEPHWMNLGVFHAWFRDRNRSLQSCLPWWIGHGLSEFIGSARLKSGRLDFSPHVWQSVQLKKVRRDSALIPAKDWFVMPGGSMRARDRADLQSQFFVSFLLQGGAQRNAAYRDVLAGYLKQLIVRLDSEDLTALGLPERDPMTEEEENQVLTRRAQVWGAEESATLDRIVPRVFAGWTDREWDAFDAAYRQDLK